MSDDDMKKLLAKARAKLQVDQVREDMSEQVEDAHRARIAAIHELGKAAERDLLRAQVDVLKDALGQLARLSPATLAQQPAVPTAPPAVFPQLHTLVETFLKTFPKNRRAQMFKKHQAALGLLIELHGAKPIDQLRQAHIVDYFNVVEGLPPRWAGECKKRGIKPRALAAEEHLERLGKKTFEDNYEVPVRLFLRWARLNWQDQGFPLTLTTEGIEFSGEDNTGKNMQRAMSLDELKRLFHGELTRSRDDPNEVHKWWLPVLSFYTGARVNELCQLNPQTDILVSPEGIDYLLITEDTESDDRVSKSVKTGIHRLVPLHPDLIAGGFLAYVEMVKCAGAKLLFPAWSPTNSRASTQAERWFRDLLRVTRLRDETPYARLVGFHAFRHTLLTRSCLRSWKGQHGRPRPFRPAQ